jgi:RNA polymerase sigma factor for flagellar operon FliA
VLAVEKKQMKEMIAKFIDQLPEKEKLVLSLYYIEDLNLKEVGKIMNLTESRISQIRTGAIVRLRGKLADLAKQNKVSTVEIL